MPYSNLELKRKKDRERIALKRLNKSYRINENNNKKKYYNDINNINKIEKNLEFDNIKPVNNYNKEIKIIKPSNKELSESTIELYITTICSILGKLPKKKYKDTYLIYANQNKDYIKKYKIERENTETEADERYISYDDKDILSNLNKLKGKYKVIYALYSLIPPRRLKDYQLNIINENENINDKSKNYLILKDNIANYFIINNYKTSKKYNTFKNNIESELLKDILTEYAKNNKELIIKSNEIKETYKLLGINNMTIAYIRKSYLMYKNEKGDFIKMTKKDRIELAEKMGHSLDEQLNYIKVIKEE